jgi:hypothetical protein
MQVHLHVGSSLGFVDFRTLQWGQKDLDTAGSAKGTLLPITLLQEISEQPSNQPSTQQTNKQNKQMNQTYFYRAWDDILSSHNGQHSD